MVGNLPRNAGDAGSIPGQRTKLPHAMGQLSLHTTNTEPIKLDQQSRHADGKDVSEPGWRKGNK